MERRITQQKWLTTKIQYENDLYIKDVIELLCNKVFNWIQSKSDFFLIMDYDTFRMKFIEFIYNKYSSNN